MAEIANADFLSTARRNRRTVSQMKEKMTQLSRPGTSPKPAHTCLPTDGQYSSAEQNQSSQLPAKWVTHAGEPPRQNSRRGR
jgi:hypothetical protein